MLHRFLSSAPLWVWLASLAWAGCADTSVVDYDGGLDAMPRETRSLELLSEPRLALMSGDSIELEARYTDRDGRLLPNATLRFALDGRADDSSLNVLEAQTDDAGIARATLIAGTTPTAFRVRVSADDASPVYVDVSVSDAGFGRLQVTPVYAGERVYDELSVTLFIGSECSDDLTLDARGDRNQALDAGESEVLFVGLPAGTPLAAVGRVRNDAGLVLARGCVDGLSVDAMSTLETELAVDDLPLVPTGSYEVATGFDSSGDRLAADLDELISRLLPSGGSSEILDAAEATFRETGAEEAARRLAMERDEGLDERLGGAFEERGPGAGLVELSRRVREELSHVEVAGVLRVGPDFAPEFETRGVGAGVEMPEPLDLDTMGIDMPVTLESSVSEDGAVLLIDTLEIGLRGGDLVRAIAARAASDVEIESGREWLGSHAQCESLVGELESICGADCLRMACERVTEQTLDRFFEGLSLFDARRATLDLSGAANLEATGGNLTVDQVDGVLRGVWASDGGEATDELEADFDGERIVPPS